MRPAPELLKLARVIDEYDGAAPPAFDASSPAVRYSTMVGQLQAPHVSGTTRRAARELDKQTPTAGSPPILGLEKWQARVIDVREDAFTVELEGEAEDGAIHVDFAVDLLGPERDVAPGDHVYVTVRTVRDRFGYPARTSSVRLRRLGRWSQDDLDNIKSRARARAARLASLAD